MELLQLRYFQAVATSGNMSKAAEELFVSQPNLSISISRLEKELGVSLFDRRKGRVVLNRNGEQFLRYVEQSLSILDSGIQELQRRNDGQSSLSLAFMTGDRELLKSFVLAHPEISIRYQTMNMQELTQALLDQSVDVAWTMMPPNDDRLNYRVIYESEFVMLMNENHPLANQPALFRRELADEQFAIDSSRIDLDRFYSDCRKKGLIPNITHNVHELDLVLALVQSGHCVAPFPDTGYQKLALAGRTKGIVRKRLSDGPPVASSCIVWNKSVPLSKPSQLLQDFIQQYFDDIVHRFQEQNLRHGE